MYPEHVVIVYVSFMYLELDFVSFGVISAINEHTLRQSSSAACSPEGTNQVRREGSSVIGYRNFESALVLTFTFTRDEGAETELVL